MYYCLSRRRIKEDNIVISIFSLMIIASLLLMMMTTSDCFSPTHFAYGQPDQTNSNNTKSLNVQNIPAKKVHVGDIDIAYKVLSKVMSSDYYNDQLFSNKVV
jgi:hypothetical protein